MFTHPNHQRPPRIDPALGAPPINKKFPHRIELCHIYEHMSACLVPRCLQHSIISAFLHVCKQLISRQVAAATSSTLH